jgi:hypothetical protein
MSNVFGEDQTSFKLSIFSDFLSIRYKFLEYRCSFLLSRFRRVKWILNFAPRNTTGRAFFMAVKLPQSGLEKNK